MIRETDSSKEETLQPNYGLWVSVNIAMFQGSRPERMHNKKYREKKFKNSVKNLMQWNDLVLVRTLV